MFAILISEANRDKIMEHQRSLPENADDLSFDTFRDAAVPYYYITGLHATKPEIWGCYPKHLFASSFIFDPEKIESEWDIVLRRHP